MTGNDHAADRIVRVSATTVEVPIHFDDVGESKDRSLGACLCEVETADGLIGHGFTGLTNTAAAAAVIELACAKAVIGEDAMRNEQLWERLYWAIAPRGQTGLASHAIAAIDIALWDIKGKRLGEPIWRLLGGARAEVPTYTTFGFDFLTRDQLAAAAAHWVRLGHTRLKMTVAADALRLRDRPRPIAEVLAEDVRRVYAVREAAGPDAEIYLDANGGLQAYDALRFAREVTDASIAFFEEPITQNDVRQLAELRCQIAIPLAAGQNEGLAFRYRDLLVAAAVDVIQPNVVIGGGFTQAARVAVLAGAFNVPIDNGGGWPFHNMHLHAGCSNGGMVEYHLPAVRVCEALFDDLPSPVDGRMAVPERPGLGFSPNPAAVAEYAV